MKNVIEKRKYTYLQNALDDMSLIVNAGFYCDLICLKPEPKGFGIPLDDYFEVTVFKWDAVNSEG